jgi:hypothetical protein
MPVTLFSDFEGKRNLTEKQQKKKPPVGRPKGGFEGFPVLNQKKDR